MRRVNHCQQDALTSIKLIRNSFAAGHAIVSVFSSTDKPSMVLQNLDLNLRDIVIFAILVWLFIRYTWVMSALTIMLAGAALLVLLPLDIYYSLLPLALLGLGLGMLFHHYQQRQLTLKREARTPRTYTKKQDELHL
ncbi:hypothetical protein [Candidatus Pantoea formicae]|uniref:hypothetical protein n=1 Tax=Candidatus Pantoea formicae TaxID=2608355 RepID=UPI003EDB1B9C